MNKKNTIIISTMLIVSLVAVQMPVPVSGSQNYFQNFIPPFPEDAKREKINWAVIDWEREVVLPTDRAAFYKKTKELEAQGKYDEIVPLAPQKTKLKEKKALDFYNIPQEVKFAVSSYAQSSASSSSPQQIQTDTKENTWYNSHFIDLGVAPPKNAKKFNPVQTKLQDNVKLKSKVQESMPPLYKATLEHWTQKKGKKTGFLTIPADAGENRAQESFWHKLVHFFSPKNAHAQTLRFIVDYYDGIEKNKMDYLMYYFSTVQNDDGSFGETSQFEQSVEVAFLLSLFNRVQNDQYDLLLNYIRGYAPKNNREKALKARVLYALGEPYLPLLDELVASQNEDFGFGFDKTYPSDPLTTLEVVAALNITGYPDTGSQSAGLWYALSQVSADGSMVFFKDADPSVHLIAMTLEYLKPFENSVIQNESSQIIVQDKINAMLSYLSGQYDEETQTLRGSSGAHDDLAVLRSFQLYVYDPNKQEILESSSSAFANANGSYGTSLFSSVLAAKVFAKPDIEVVSVAPSGSLTSYESAQFQIEIKNNGYRHTDSLELHVFIDKFAQSPVVIPSSTLTLAPGQSAIVVYDITDSASLAGAMDFEFYIESGFEYEQSGNWLAQTYTFAPSVTGEPAMPVYYIAHSHEVNGFAGINFRLGTHQDTTLDTFVLMFKPQGATEWQYVVLPQGWNGAFVYPLEEGAVYEATVGALNTITNEVSYLNDVTVVSVSANELLNTSSLSGEATQSASPLADVQILGYSLVSQTDSNGIFSASSIPNGSSAVWINGPQFEQLATKFIAPPSASVENVRAITRLKEDTEAPEVVSVLLPGVVDAGNVARNKLEYEIVVDGTDNIAIKDADFYYYEPAEDAWLYIGTQSANITQVRFNWYIPESLLGTEYKVRAVLWDFQNNQSAPLESAPFNIVEGTVPIGTVAVQGLVNNTWNLGETKTVEWNLDMPNPVEVVSFELFTSWNSYSIGAGINVGLGTYEYAIPADQVYVTDAAHIEMTACDVYVNCTTISTDSFIISETSPPPPPPWQDMQELNLEVSAIDLYREIQETFTGPNGEQEFIYIEEDGLAWDPSGMAQRLVYRKLLNGAWQPPVVLKEYLYYEGVNEPSAYRNIQTTQAGNGIHIVYQQEIGTGLSGWDSAEIFYALVQNGSLVSQKQITNNATQSTQPEVAVRADGQVYIAWRDGYRYTASPSGMSTLRWVEGDGGASWSAEQQLTTMHTRLHALALKNGDPALVYRDSDAFVALERSGGVWQNPVTIITETDVLDTDLFILQDGSYDLFYYQGTPSTSYRYSLYRLQFTPDYAAQSATIHNQYDVIDRQGTQDMRNYRIISNNDDTYHLFYVLQETVGTSQINHLYYSRLVDSEHYLLSRVTPLYFYVNDQVSAASFKDGIVQVYYTGWITNSDKALFSYADFGAAYQYAFNPVSPAAGQTDVARPTAASWQWNGPSAQQYHIRYGLNKGGLSDFTGPLASPDYTFLSLNSDTKYYWQVYGTDGEDTFYSNIWNFTTGSAANTEPLLTIVIKDTNIVSEHIYSAVHSTTVGPEVRVTSTGSLEVQAGEVIYLKPGFTTEPGASFKASIIEN